MYKIPLRLQSTRTYKLLVVHRATAAMGFHPCITAITQLVGTYALGILVVLCAYAGYTVTGSILEVCPDGKIQSSTAHAFDGACHLMDDAMLSAQCACNHTTRTYQDVRKG